MRLLFFPLSGLVGFFVPFIYNLAQIFKKPHEVLALACVLKRHLKIESVVYGN